jgi:uncharacterized protein (TIGR03085 family)
MTIARDERAALATTLREVGPDAPTLCDGWTTRDLTAHLIVREYRLDAMPGILIPAFAGRTKTVQDQMTGQDWEEMVSKFEAGPPVYSPLKLLDRVANVSEMFVHHEDVRRGSAPWEPRILDAASEKAILTPLKTMGKRAIVRSPARVELTTPDGTTVTSGGRGPTVTVTGAPLELLLFVFGRKEAVLDYAGDADAIAAVKAAKRGL